MILGKSKQKLFYSGVAIGWAGWAKCRVSRVIENLRKIILFKHTNMVHLKI